MSSGSHDLVLFLGRFHPVLVHLPIGGLVLLGVLELVAKFSRFKDAAQNNRLILGLTAAASVDRRVAGLDAFPIGRLRPAVVAVAQVDRLCRRCGLHGDLPAELAGPAPGVSALAAGDARRPGRREPPRRLDHPRARLSDPLCAGAAALAVRGEWPGRRQRIRTPPDLLQRRVFADVVQPILLQRCSACHGPEKQKADLRLDSLEALLKGGKSGPALVAGKASDSRMIQRLLLPLNDEDHMPPEGKPQPTPGRNRGAGVVDRPRSAGGRPTRRRAAPRSSICPFVLPADRDVQ